MKKLHTVFLTGLFLAALHLPSKAQTYTWSTVRIGGGGFVTSINAHPKVPNLRFITTDVGNPYRWNNSTQAWEGLMNNFPAVYWPSTCSNLTFDPQDVTGNILYATMGKGATAGSGAGTIVRSADRGTTWTDLNMPVWVSPNEAEKSNGERLVVDPLNDSLVYVTTRRPKNASETTTGLYRSVNYGGAWTKLDTIYGSFIVFDTAAGLSSGRTKNVYVGAPAGVYRSTNGGTSFTLMTGSPLNLKRGVLRGGRLLYAASSTGIYKWNDTAWSNITPSGGTGNYFGVEVNPNNSRQVIISTGAFTGTMYITGDAGGNWTKLTTTRDFSEIPWAPSGGNAGNTISDFAWDPFNAGEVWFSDLLNVYQTTNVWATPSSNWKVRAVGHEEVVVDGPLVCPASGINLLLTPTADVAGFDHTSLVNPPARSLIAPFQYANSSGVETTGAAYEEANPNYLVRVGRRGWGGTGLGGYSTDGGVHYNAWVCPAGMAGGRIAVSATSETMVWTTQNGYTYRSADRGTTWTKITSIGLAALGYYNGTGDIFSIPAAMNPLAADKVNGNKFYIYLSGVMYVSTDGGATFTAGYSGLPSITNPGVGNIAYINVETTPGKEGDIWVSVEGNGLYHSTNSGANFTKISNVQSAKLMAVGKAATTNPTVYVFGTVNSVANIVSRSDDNGASWTTVANPPVQQLLMLAADKRVYGRVILGTAGSGIFYGEAAPAAVTGVLLSKARDTVAVGNRDTLKAYVIPAWAANKVVAWSSSDTTKAKVDTNGVILGTGVGTAIITVTTQDGSKTARDTVVVTTPVYATGVTLSPSPAAVAAGSSLTLTATVTPSNASNKTVAWVSSDTTKATVSNGGVATGTGAGTVLIKATALGGQPTGARVAAQDTVTVSVVIPIAVSIDSGAATVSVPDTLRLKANLIPSNTSNKKVTWISSNASIATVDSTGLVKGVAAGTVTITATSVSGGLTATKSLTVAAESLCGSLLNSGFESGLHNWTVVNSSLDNGPSSAITTVAANVHSGSRAVMVSGEGGVSSVGSMPVNGAQQVNFSGWGKIEDGPQWAGFGIDYVDSAGQQITQDVLTVSGTSYTQYSVSRVTPANTARMSIWTYKSGNTGRLYLDDFCATATNVVHVTGVTVTPNPSTVAIGYTRTLTATVTPSNASTKSVTWTSSNPLIATVNATGVVTGVALGTDTITATTTDGSFVAVSVVNVTNFVAVTGLTLNPDSVSIGVADKFTLTPVITPSTASVTTVTWVSSNTAVATVNSSGVVSAIAVGTATITATTTSGGKTATGFITVVPEGSCGSLVNNGFESSLVNWANTNGASAITTNSADVHNGLKAVVTTAQGGISYVGSIPVTAGNTAEFKVWAKVSGGPVWAGLSADFQDASGTKLATLQFTVTATSYTLYDSSITIPAGTAHINIWAFKSGTVGALYLDDFCLTSTAAGGSSAMAKMSGNSIPAMPAEGEVSVNAFPNPVESGIYLDIINYKGSQVEARLTDIGGRLLHREIILTTGNGHQRYQLHPGRKPAKGQYILTVTGKELFKNIKLVVL
ncbi:Ig-like domain-containing protein [Flavitalea flava]